LRRTSPWVLLVKQLPLSALCFFLFSRVVLFPLVTFPSFLSKEVPVSSLLIETTPAVGLVRSSDPSPETSFPEYSRRTPPPRLCRLQMISDPSRAILHRFSLISPPGLFQGRFFYTMPHFTSRALFENLMRRSLSERPSLFTFLTKDFFPAFPGVWCVGIFGAFVDPGCRSSTIFRFGGGTVGVMF